MKAKTGTDQLGELVHNLVALHAALARAGSIDEVIAAKQAEVAAIDAKLAEADTEALRIVAIGEEIRRAAEKEVSRRLADADAVRRQADDVLAQARVQAQDIIADILKGCADSEAAAKARMQEAHAAAAAADKVLADIDVQINKRTKELTVAEDRIRALHTKRYQMQAEIGELRKRLDAS
jgi:chromosome segregation ATPase